MTYSPRLRRFNAIQTTRPTSKNKKWVGNYNHLASTRGQIPWCCMVSFPLWCSCNMLIVFGWNAWFQMFACTLRSRVSVFLEHRSGAEESYSQCVAKHLNIVFSRHQYHIALQYHSEAGCESILEHNTILCPPFHWISSYSSSTPFGYLPFPNFAFVFYFQGLPTIS